MSESTLKILRSNLEYFSRTSLRIRTKTGGIEPFIFNRPQKFLHAILEKQRLATGLVRAVVVKGRQLGCSTYIAARYFHSSLFIPGTDVFILTHHSESTQHLFEMVKEFYSSLPQGFKNSVSLGASNRKELIFDKLRSSYHVGTAGSGAIGRGTTLQKFHGSEVGFFTNTDEIATGVMQAVGDVPGTELILESTANGIGNYFHKMALVGLRPESSFATIFLPWFWMPEYTIDCPSTVSFSSKELDIQNTYGLTDGQLYWRRRKIEDVFKGEEWQFSQEFPCTLQEAFITSSVGLYNAEQVQGARGKQVEDAFAPVVMGIDPSHERDRTCFVIRKGRQVVHVRSYKGGDLDDPKIAGVAAQLIEDYTIDMTFIDIGNGYGAYDILRNLGYGNRVTKIHFGQRSLQPELFQNKRVEMAHSSKEWFRTDTVGIPDDEEFVADLLVMPDLERTTGRGVMSLKPKEAIKKDLGGMSQDYWDAFILTFAFPVASREMTRVTSDIRAKIVKQLKRKNISVHRNSLHRVKL